MQWPVAKGDWLAGLLPKSPSSPKLLNRLYSPAFNALLFSSLGPHMSPGISMVHGKRIQTIASLDFLDPPIHNGAFRRPLRRGNHTQGSERDLGGPAMDAANLRNLH